MIVKVEWPISENETDVLISSEDGSVNQTFPKSEELRRRLFDDGPPSRENTTQFFHARIDDAKNLRILRRTAQQEWR